MLNNTEIEFVTRIEKDCDGDIIYFVRTIYVDQEGIKMSEEEKRYAY